LAIPKENLNRFIKVHDMSYQGMNYSKNKELDARDEE
jgi:hypothetical protein